MIIKALKNLTEPLVLDGPDKTDKTVTLFPRGSVEVGDSWINLPVLKSAIAKSMVAITNFCGFVIGEGVSKITVSDSPPPSPRTGDLWIDIS